MALRVVVLGAGFGGLELTSMLSEQLGDDLALTLIDRNDAFVFGFSKLDVMFGRKTPDAVRVPYRSIVKRGVQFRQELVTAIDPAAKRVTTDRGSYEADVLVIALGADYDPAATPGLLEGGHEFYSVAGAIRARDVVASFTRGHAIVGVTSTPFKCPPAPSETVLLLHDLLTARGVRGACQISLVMPFPVPVPPSPATSQALMAAFAERGIQFVSNHLVRALDAARRVAVLDDGAEMPYDLFLGIPRHRVPEAVAASGLADGGWVQVDPATLATKYPGVYAVGDVTNAPTPKAGVFAEGAARIVARSIVAQAQRGEAPGKWEGAGSCYVEFGAGRVGRVDVNFLSGPKPTGTHTEASEALAVEKQLFGSSRRTKWFGVD